jgi:peptide-methionine (S)-S-oxide reductase
MRETDARSRPWGFVMRHNSIRLAVSAVIVVAAAIVWGRGMFAMPESKYRTRAARTPPGPPPARSQQATFGAGCFWCTEVLFQQLNGVHAVIPGYSGGSVKNPTYDQVCNGTTGHAEAVQIIFDPKVISFPELLEVFWRTHNPTTRNRQGNDVGSHYRSVIFYHTPEQRDLAEHYKRQLDDSGAFQAPIVTEIVPFLEFYPAEAYHQHYFEDHPGQPYCFAVIRPKLEKFEKVFADKLRAPSPE